MEAGFRLEAAPQGQRLILSGDWTVWTIGDADARLRALAARLGPGLTLDLSRVEKVDVAGAYLISRTARGAPGAKVEGASEGAGRLIEAASAAAPQPAPEARPAPWTPILALERFGRAVARFGADALETLSFLGATLIVLARLTAEPRRWRLVSVVAVMEEAGLKAAPIVVTLSFAIGLVVAYVSVSVLADFGLEVFTIEGVGVGVLREFAVVITAVLLAGRTDSAFTAEIGAMKMRQELDAMRVLGLDVMERLVAPRVLAMTVMTPLLTLAAMFAGLAGGLLVAWTALGVSPILFIDRLQDNVPAENFWIGLIKAPVFGFMVALVGCRHGLRVGGDVASLGRETTASVVEAIFLVILLDAVFAIYFLELGW